MTSSHYRKGDVGERIAYAYRETNLGGLLMAATDSGVCFAHFGDGMSDLVRQLQAEFPQTILAATETDNMEELDNWIDALEQHVSTATPCPDLPLDLRGTAFQIRVWQFLIALDEGDVLSYSELAQGIDKTKAVRAAASACGANRIAVLVPCHRVLRSDGGIGGYRWGVSRKRTLLDMERVRKVGVQL
jgi:AraC family transcriptional regulator of adaptative response/methylated-DNA-[protein]-cysteine methyltransferase